MRFERLDLNLLVALDVLIEERNVSAAAKRLHLSQPAVSGSLNRLREFFGDDLLVLSGRQMILTPKALELAGPVREALMLIRNRITTPVRFDPSQTERLFKIIASDYVFIVLLADTLASLSHIAPGISFDVLAAEPRNLELIERGEADLLITINEFIRPEYPHVELFGEEFAVICWSGSKFGQSLSQEDFQRAGHSICYIGAGRFPSFSEGYFDERGIDRRAEIYVPHFTMLPQSVIGTNRLATLQKRYADYCAKHFPIKVFPAPFDIPKIREIAQWHPMRDNDAGLAWLVETIRQHALKLG